MYIRTCGRFSKLPLIYQATFSFYLTHKHVRLSVKMSIQPSVHFLICLSHTHTFNITFNITWKTVLIGEFFMNILLFCSLTCQVFPGRLWHGAVAKADKLVIVWLGRSAKVVKLPRSSDKHEQQTIEITSIVAEDAPCAPWSSHQSTVASQSG